MKKQGKLFLIGVGPGDPDLMTYRAVRMLEDADVIIAPRGSRHGASSALATASAQVDMEDKKIIQLYFPMKKVFAAGNGEQDQDVLHGWHAAAEIVLTHIYQGKDVAFPTIGDPAIYSTAFYLLATIDKIRHGIEVMVVPGIPAMSACAAAMQSPLGLGDERITVIPAAFEHADLGQVLEQPGTTVLMKVHRRMDQLVKLVEEKELVDSAVLIERCGLPGQQIFYDIRDALGRDLHYFSTMIIRKSHGKSR